MEKLEIWTHYCVPAPNFGSARRNVRGCRGGTKGGGHRTLHRFGKEFGRRFGKDIWERNYEELQFVVWHAVVPHEGGGGFKAQARTTPGLKRVHGLIGRANKENQKKGKVDKKGDKRSLSTVEASRPVQENKKARK